MGKMQGKSQVENPEPTQDLKTALMEAYLMRSISHESFNQEVLEGDWKILLNWPEATNCRLFWEVIISHSTDPKSPFHSSTLLFIAQQKNYQFPTAVALNRSRYSSESRSGVLEYFDYFKISAALPTQQANDLWESLRYQKPGESAPSWQDITNVLDLKDWEATPPIDQPELWNACRRLLNNPPAENLDGMVGELIETPNFDKMPLLKRRVVELALWPESRFVLRFALEQFPSFIDAMVDLLIKFDIPEQMFHNRRPDDFNYCYNILNTYSMIVTNRFPYKESGKLESLLELLKSGARYCWNWQIIVQVLRLPGIPSKEGLILNWIKAMRQHPIRSAEENKDRVRFVMGSAEQEKCWQDLTAIVQILSPREAIGLFGLIMEDRYLTDYAEIPRLLGNHPELVPTVVQMQQEPKYCRETLAHLVFSGKVSEDVVIRYYQALGIKDTREAILKWIEYCGDAVNFDRELIITKIVIPNNLPAGNLLPRHAEALFELGYQLKPKDIAEARTLNQLLQNLTDGVQIRYCRIWDPNKPQWAQVLLKSKIELSSILTSLFESLPRIAVDQRDNFINMILLPACQGNEMLTHATGRFVWDSDQPSAGHREMQEMRKIVATDPIFSQWIGSDGKKYYINEYVQTMGFSFLLHEQKTAAVLFPKDEQITIFLTNADENPKNRFYQLKPAEWRFLFDDESQKRFRDWLFVKWPKLGPAAWMGWIEEFGFISDERLPHIINKFLESLDQGIAKKAAQIREKIWQLAKT